MSDIVKKGKKAGGVIEVATLPDGIPFYIEGGIVLRMRQSVLTISKGDEEIGDVTVGAGLGGDFVQMEWKGRQATFYLRDVLKRWVATFDSDGAAEMPETEFKVDYEEETK